MNAAVERDLLYGLLALQSGLIDQEQLVAAFRLWARGKSRPMEEVFAGRGDLDNGQRVLIAALVAEHLKMHGGETAASLAAVDARASTREALMGIGDVDLTTSIVHSVGSQTDTDGDRTATFAPGPQTSDGQRFRVLRPHARGGLGVVFVALDQELHREVAVKEIRDSQADNPASRARFVLEAEITGGLEHPGIVPVYALGTHGNGRPYYAMRFIRGDSLKDAIAGFHADPVLKANPGARGLALRKLLRRFVDVCNAIEYAHGRGVLHRDLKPGNVMVGKYGETIVVDWGVAKATGRHELGSDADERTLQPRSASGSSETLPGSAIGTPSYMSPEQAAGQLDRLGPRSDVYSLGATLYCLLAGRSPFDGRDAGAVLQAVQKGRFPSPRSIDASIPMGLEAISLKAMALVPDDRYGSPRAMAEDIERWMADEPISARRDPWTAKAARWARRNRSAVVGAAAVLISAVAALSVGTLLLSHANARVEQQRRIADENARMARSAVDDYLTKVSEDRLLKSPQPGMQALRKELLSTALGYYQDFLRRREGDPTAREDLAAAYFRVGEINSVAGTTLDAAKAFQASHDLWAILASEQPGVFHYQVESANSERRLGVMQLYMAGQAAEAEAHLRKSAERLEALRRRRPDDPDLLLGLSKVYNSLSSRALKTRQADEPALLEKAIEAVERLAHIAPGKHDADLADALMHRGYRFAREGRGAEALRDHERAREILLRLVAASPHDTELLSELGRAYLNIGFVHQSITRDAAEARRQFALSTKIDERLVEENPRVAIHRERLAGNWKQDLETRIQSGQREGLDEDAKKIVAMLESAAALDPENHAIKFELAHGYDLLGEMLEASQPDRALAAFAKSVELQKAVVKGDPNNLKYRFDLTRSYNGLARALIATGKPKAALDLLRGFVADNPADGMAPDDKIRIALFHSQCESVMADALRLLGRRDEAITLLRHVQAVRLDMDRREPSSRQHRSGVLRAQIELGLALRESAPEEAASILTLAESQLAASSPRDPAFFLLRIAVRAAIGEIQPAHRVDFHERAMSDLKRAVAAGIVEPTWLEREPGLNPLRVRADFQDLRAQVQSASEARFFTRRAGWDEAKGRPDAASEDYRLAAASVEGLARPSAVELYNLGCFLAQSSRLAKKADREALAGRAMDALRRATNAGFRDLAQFQTDADLDVLRPRADFRLLLLDLSFPSRPFAGE